MDYLTLILLALGLSLDDFGLAFVLSLLFTAENLKRRLIYAGKMAVAFSTSTAILPLLGWLLGLAIYDWVARFSAWIVLIVFCGVGGKIIKEAFEDEKFRSMKNNSSFLILLTTGILGSLDEGAIGISFPFLEISIFWIIFAVILTNIVLIYLAILAGGWIRDLNREIPPILSGMILIILGVLKFFELSSGD